MSHTLWTSDAGWIDENTLRTLAAILWPTDDPERDPDEQWTPDTLDAIADVMTEAGYAPDPQP